MGGEGARVIEMRAARQPESARPGEREQRIRRFFPLIDEQSPRGVRHKAIFSALIRDGEATKRQFLGIIEKGRPMLERMNEILILAIGAGIRLDELEAILRTFALEERDEGRTAGADILENIANSILEHRKNHGPRPGEVP